VASGTRLVASGRTRAMRLAELSPQAFCDHLRDRGIDRLFLVPDGDGVRASHPALDDLASFVSASPDLDGHEGIFVQRSPTGVLQAGVVHRTCRGQGAGGLRMWTYDTVGDLLTDGMRLARGMTHKNALAGLWWGGGKGVMAAGTGGGARSEIYADYGRFITSLNGCYITAEDVGTSVEDMAAIFSTTRFTTCIPPSVGGSGNPSVPTARGVVRGMEAGLAHLGMGTLEGKSVAVQGLGHVGGPLCSMLAERGVARIVGADIDAANLEALRLPRVELELSLVERGDASILAADVDVVSPNATGGVLNAETIPTIRAPLVCGAANNQLGDDKIDDRRLADAGVLYLPDFLVNRMGIVTCADEASGYVTPDPIIEQHLGADWDNSIYRLTLAILAECDASGRTPAAVALERAEAASFEVHPIQGHRGAAIIESLVREGWAG